MIKNGNTARLCSIDLSKAFDKVNHHGLFFKVNEKIYSSRASGHIRELHLPSCSACVKWQETWSPVLMLTLELDKAQSCLLFYLISTPWVAHILKHNFGKCWPILKILSLLDSPRNLQQNYCYISQCSLSVLLHYLAKYKRSKISIIIIIIPATIVKSHSSFSDFPCWFKDLTRHSFQRRLLCTTTRTSDLFQTSLSFYLCF